MKNTMAALAFLFTALAYSNIAAGVRPPNLVIVLTDDQGYADVGFNGCKDIRTPNLDRLAKEGVRFTNAYATYAVCGPSRAGLITGRYQDRFGASRNPTVDYTVENNGVPTSEKNIAELLQPAGYTSMAVGKWHLGTHPTLRPRKRGFNEFFGFLTGGHQYFPEELTIERLKDVTRKWDWYRTKLLRNETPVEIDEYLTDELTDAAVDFIGRTKDKPFFLYLAYNAPHTPLQASKKYLKRYKNIADKKRRTYAAMVSAVDDGVGRILDELNKHSIDEDTIIVFLSDNGGAKNNASDNKPLRGHKSSPFEGGIRVPFAMRWPGHLPAGVTYEHPIISLDIAATIVARAGVTVPANKPLDGVDLLPYLTGENKGKPHERLYWRWYDRKQFVIRDGDRKLITRQGRDDMLFNLQGDLSEKSNLAAQQRDQVTELQAQLRIWNRQLVDPIAPGLSYWNPKKR